MLFDEKEGTVLAVILRSGLRAVWGINQTA